MGYWLISVPVIFGLESIVAREIRGLGYETSQVEDGRVSFYGDERAVCRANLWLRTAERVQIKLGDFIATSFSELFDKTKELPWASLLPADAAFPVKGHSLSSKLASVPDCQSIVKKAVVESLKAVWKADRFSESGSLYRIHFNIIKERVTIYVDTSGEGLHKRGYRENPSATPIRETLAAALVILSGWRPGRALWDPFCGSGTIPVEAAMIVANRAPGLFRSFTAETWALPPEDGSGEGAGRAPQQAEDARVERRRSGIRFKPIWDEERAEAMAVYEKTYAGLMAQKRAVEIAGSDIMRNCVQMSRQNAAKAGVAAITRFFQMDSKDMSLAYRGLSENGVKFSDSGFIVANPPYGERFDDEEGAMDICREWAEALSGMGKWGLCVISALGGFERIMGRPASKRRKLYNGKIKCQAYIYKPEA